MSTSFHMRLLKLLPCLIDHWPLSDPDVPLSSIRLPTNTCHPLRVVRNSWVSIVSPSLCTDDVQSKSRIGLTTFPTPALPGFLHLDWSLEPQRYYVVIRLPECHLPPSFIQLVGHTTVDSMRNRSLVGRSRQATSEPHWLPVLIGY